MATLALLFVTPYSRLALWLTLGACFALATMHGIYWVLIHPVNKVWLEEKKLGGAGGAFFSVGGKGRLADNDWTALRDRWEYSHVARAALALAGLIALVAAAVIEML